MPAEIPKETLEGYPGYRPNENTTFNIPLESQKVFTGGMNDFTCVVIAKNVRCSCCNCFACQSRSLVMNIMFVNHKMLSLQNHINKEIDPTGGPGHEPLCVERSCSTRFNVGMLMSS